MSNSGKVIIAGIIISMFIFLSCSKPKNGSGQQYDQKALLVNISDSIILPTYDSMFTQTDSLVTALEDFTASVNNTTLTRAQNKWKAAMTAWIKCQAFAFGPAEGTTMLDNAVYFWPCKPDLIKTELNGSNTITESYITTLGAPKKGLPALEYLLFNPISNAAVIDSFTTAINATRRKAYVLALAQNIQSNISAVLTEWKNNYTTTFKNATGTDLGSSVSMLYNALVINVEESKNFRLGIPLGRKNNTSIGSIEPGLVEAPYSDYSIALLKANQQTIENIFSGKHGNVEGTGFDDMLDVLQVTNREELLSAKIKQQLTIYKNAIAAIPDPLSGSLTTNKAAVETAWTESKKLIVLLKVDAPSTLGILITFSDNDGD